MHEHQPRPQHEQFQHVRALGLQELEHERQERTGVIGRESEAEPDGADTVGVHFDGIVEEEDVEGNGEDGVEAEDDEVIADFVGEDEVEDGVEAGDDEGVDEAGQLPPAEADEEC